MHKFKEGDTVTCSANSRVRRAYPAGAYKIVAVMPREDSQIESSYRIRHVVKNVDRVAVEGDLMIYECVLPLAGAKVVS